MITLVLILSLFYPRLALIIGYAGNGILPNPFSFWVDFWLAFFVPRLLVITYIAVNWYTLDSPVVWLVLHIIALILSNLVDDKD